MTRWARSDSKEGLTSGPLGDDLEDRRHGAGGEGGTGPAAHEESQMSTASERKRALAAAVRAAKTAEETAGYNQVRPVV